MSATDVRKTPGRATIKDKGIVEEALQEVEAEVKKADEVVVDFAKRLQGKTVLELRILRDEALVDESEAKRFLVLLRQRAANMASSVGAEVEQEIIAAKEEWAKAVAWLAAIEKKLENEFLDIYGSKK